MFTPRALLTLSSLLPDSQIFRDSPAPVLYGLSYPNLTLLLLKHPGINLLKMLFFVTGLVLPNESKQVSFNPMKGNNSKGALHSEGSLRRI